jgi:hypothetical protein
MKITVVLSDLGVPLTGESKFFDSPDSGHNLDRLEREGIGFWMQDSKPASRKYAHKHRDPVFVPWTSCLYVVVPGKENKNVSDHC